MKAKSLLLAAIFGFVSLVTPIAAHAADGPSTNMLAAPDCVAQLSKFSKEQLIEFGKKRLSNRDNQLGKLKQSIEKRYSQLEKSKTKQGSSVADHKKDLLAEVDQTDKTLEQQKALVGQGDPAAICSITTKTKVYNYLSKKVTYQMAVDTLSVANDVNLSANNKLKSKADINDQSGEIKAAQALIPSNLEEYNTKNAADAKKNYFASTVSPKIKQIKKANSANKKKISAKAKSEKKSSRKSSSSSSSSSGGSSSSNSSSSGGNNSSGGGSSGGSSSGGSSSSGGGSSSSGGGSSGSSGSSSSGKKDKKPTAAGVCKDLGVKGDWQKRACREGATRALSSKDYGGDASKACNKKGRKVAVYEECAKGYKAAYKKLTGKSAKDSGFNHVYGTKQTAAERKKMCVDYQKKYQPGLNKKEAKLVQDACILGASNSAEGGDTYRFCETGNGRWDQRATKRISACRYVLGG